MIISINHDIHDRLFVELKEFIYLYLGMYYTLCILCVIYIRKKKYNKLDHFDRII